MRGIRVNRFTGELSKSLSLNVRGIIEISGATRADVLSWETWEEIPDGVIERLYKEVIAEDATIKKFIDWAGSVEAVEKIQNSIHMVCASAADNVVGFSGELDLAYLAGMICSELRYQDKDLPIWNPEYCETFANEWWAKDPTLNYCYEICFEHISYWCRLPVFAGSDCIERDRACSELLDLIVVLHSLRFVVRDCRYLDLNPEWKKQAMVVLENTRFSWLSNDMAIEKERNGYLELLAEPKRGSLNR